MKRHLIIFSLTAALAVTSAWGQRDERPASNFNRLGARAAGTERSAPSKVSGSAFGRRAVLSTPGSPAATADSAASTASQAAGVVQMNLWESAGRECYFVATDTIPKGSSLQVFISLNDGTTFSLPAVTLGYTIDHPGDTYILPDLKRTGDFWQRGLTQIAVKVASPSGDVSWARTDFPTSGWEGAYVRNADDVLTYMWPGINSTREYLADDGSVMVEIKGRFFTSSTPKVVFENLVVPSDYVTLLDSSTVLVNLSKAYGYSYTPGDVNSDSSGYLLWNFDPTLMKGYLLTISQNEWADTIPFRHSPLQR